jgi:SAM-dependent methyltransferase
VIAAAAARQGAWWSADATGWAAHAEPRLRPLYDAVLADLPATSSTVLDAGCGAGAFAALAVERGHRVAGVDAAPELIRLARTRLPGADLRVGDLEALPFADQSFACTTAINSVPYASRPRRALAELARVTARGGRVLVTTGTGAASAACAAGIEPLLPADAHASSRTTFGLDDEHATRLAFHSAGLEIEHHRRIAYTVTFADRTQAIAAQLPAGPVQAAIAHSGEAAVIDALANFFAGCTGPDGHVHLDAAYHAVHATVGLGR